MDDDKKERERFDLVLDLLPHDADNCLEIGFSELHMTTLLAKQYDVVGIDLPRKKKVAFPPSFKLANASIAALPFADRSFDLVVCTEVLEHLPAPVLTAGIKELARVSRRYLLVSVPYRQRVWNEYYKCARCGFTGNSMEHLRYFDEPFISQGFPGYTIKEFRKGGSEPEYAPDILYWLANRMGNSWSELPWKCTNCGEDPGTIKPNLIGHALRRVIWRWQKALTPRPAWMLALLQVSQRSTLPPE